MAVDKQMRDTSKGKGGCDKQCTCRCREEGREGEGKGKRLGEKRQGGMGGGG